MTAGSPCWCASSITGAGGCAARRHRRRGQDAWPQGGRPGRCHDEIAALAGDNGAGRSPEARRRGIETACQDLALVKDLAVWQNIYLNRELTWGVFPLRILDRRRMIGQPERMLDRLLVNKPPVDARVRRLSGGQRQSITVARATRHRRARGPVEQLILRLRGEGIARLIVSHDLEQGMRLSDSVWVMRQGRAVAQFRRSEIDTRTIAAAITGIAADAAAPDPEPVP